MIVKALHKQMKEKSVKTRQCCFNMLTELVNVLPGALTQHIPVLIPGMYLWHPLHFTWASLFSIGIFVQLELGNGTTISIALNYVTITDIVISR